ncbi:hypothetical protein HDU79_007194 [Rhizoclosmatium sp. JEL0117]|nr:hypothetical protein HDU79_007194 [Rhizoclosmatium sp. JEL0117]
MNLRKWLLQHFHLGCVVVGDVIDVVVPVLDAVAAYEVVGAGFVVVGASFVVVAAAVVVVAVVDTSVVAAFAASEVAAVVEVQLEHLHSAPNDSLACCTASAKIQPVAFQLQLAVVVATAVEAFVPSVPHSYLQHGRASGTVG